MASDETNPKFWTLAIVNSVDWVSNQVAYKLPLYFPKDKLFFFVAKQAFFFAPFQSFQLVWVIFNCWLMSTNKCKKSNITAN